MTLKPSWTTLARVTVGCLLLAASAFKFSGMVPLWFSSVFPFAPNLWVLAVLLEMLLGLVLVTGVGWGRLALWGSVVFFVSLAAVAVTLTIQGESSCGCLGRIPLRPWGAAVLDITSIALLLAAGRSLPRDSVGLVRVSARTVCIGSVFALVAIAPAAFLYATFSDVIVVDNPVLAEFGESRSWVTVPIEIHNRGTSPVKFYAAFGPRHVKVSSELPLIIPPQSHGRLECRIYCGGTPGAFSSRLQLLTDLPSQRELIVQINGGVK